MSSLFGMKDRVVIVTGASAGIGTMIASGLSSVGARVVLAARRTEVLEALAARLPGSLAVRCDVTIADDRERLIDQTLGAFGRIDGLVNNAGAANRGVPATRETLTELRDILEI